MFENEFGDEPFIIETIEMYLKTKKRDMDRE